MGQPHKGEREQIKTRADHRVVERLRVLVAAGQASSVSQAAADVLAHALGLPDASRELGEVPALHLFPDDIDKEVRWTPARSA